LLDQTAMRNQTTIAWWGWLRLFLIALGASSGCYVTAPIMPSELALLDGYADGEPQTGTGTAYLRSPTNQKIEVVGGSQLYLDLPNGTYGGTFDTIQVRDGLFSGMTKEGLLVQAPLASIQAARVHEPNRPAVHLAHVAIGTVIVVALLAGFAAVALVHGPGTGRALRIARLAVAAPAVDVEGWDAELPPGESPAPSPEVRRALARLWTETARSEHASVPAFSRLSLSLVALGAPARLIEAAHRAALEEIEHARLAFSLASTYAEVPVGPGRLLALHAARAVTATSLAALAAESLIDGCLLEGVAADVAQQALARARDDRARAALAVIARDEASHAALAWEVVRWCCEQGGEAVQRRLLAALQKAPASVPSPRVPAHLAAELADHGWLDQTSWDEALRRTSASVASRLAALG
jgi:hypothetical protein